MEQPKQKEPLGLERAPWSHMGQLVGPVAGPPAPAHGPCQGMLMGPGCCQPLTLQSPFQGNPGSQCGQWDELTMGKVPSEPQGAGGSGRAGVPCRDLAQPFGPRGSRAGAADRPCARPMHAVHCLSHHIRSCTGAQGWGR